jgi:hypothetical protein
MFDIQIEAPQRDRGLSLPVWVHPDFLLAAAELQDVQTYHLVCRKGEQIVALMPLYEKSKFGIKRLINPVCAYYQGLWFFWQENRQPNRVLLDELNLSHEIALFLKKHYTKGCFNLIPQNQDIRGFSWAGFRAKPLYTFEQVLNEPMQIIKDEKEKLKRALNQDYTFVEKFDPDVFISMLKELHNRKEQKFRLSYSAFGLWMKQLHEAGLLIQDNLMQGERIVSSNLVLAATGETTAYTIMRCTDQAGLRSGASILHSVKLIESLQHRFTKLDFCGGNNPEVARFKAALGLKLRLFFQISH